MERLLMEVQAKCHVMDHWGNHFQYSVRWYIKFFVYLFFYYWVYPIASLVSRLLECILRRGRKGLRWHAQKLQEFDLQQLRKLNFRLLLTIIFLLACLFIPSTGWNSLDSMGTRPWRGSEIHRCEGRWTILPICSCQWSSLLNCLLPWGSSEKSTVISEVVSGAAWLHCTRKEWKVLPQLFLSGGLKFDAQ